MSKLESYTFWLQTAMNCFFVMRVNDNVNDGKFKMMNDIQIGSSFKKMRFLHFFRPMVKFSSVRENYLDRHISPSSNNVQ